MSEHRTVKFWTAYCLTTTAYLGLLYTLSIAAIGMGHGTALFLNLTLIETLLVVATIISLASRRGFVAVMLIRLGVLGSVAFASRDEYGYVEKLLSANPLIPVGWLVVLLAGQLMAAAVFWTAGRK